MPAPVKRLAPPLLALLLASLPFSVGRTAPQEPGPAIPPEAARNVRFGLPSPAKPDPERRDDYLIARLQYVLSYNGARKIPNWVCWNLLTSDIGNAARSPFEQDPRLPKGFSRVTSNVYTGVGFDRGHMCPAKDRSATAADSRAVFFMTNIVPQSPASNQRAWERLEDYCRRLAQEGKSLFIACGPAGVGGVGKNGPADQIGKGRVTVAVPGKLWKVILVLPREDAEPRKNSRVIAVIMPNDQTVDFNWAKYRVKTSAVEKLTGLRFFSAVPEEVAEALRDHLDEVNVPVPKSRKKKAGKGETP